MVEEVPHRLSPWGERLGLRSGGGKGDEGREGGGEREGDKGGKRKEEGRGKGIRGDGRGRERGA